MRSFGNFWGDRSVPYLSYFTSPVLQSVLQFSSFMAWSSVTGVCLCAASAIALPTSDSHAQGKMVIDLKVVGDRPPPSSPGDRGRELLSVNPEAVPASNRMLSQPPIPVAQTPPASRDDLDLDPTILEDSPLFQRWTDEVPDVLSEIHHDPAFRTRVRVGYGQWANEDSGGLIVGVEDVFLGRTGLTLNGDYQTTLDGEQTAYGAALRYYLLPLGSLVNIAPVVGYRHLDGNHFTTDGLQVGARAVFSLSRTGAADIAIAQTWVVPGSEEEVSTTALSFGYAVTQNLRLSTDVQWQAARERQDTRWGLLLEWMF